MGAPSRTQIGARVQHREIFARRVLQRIAEISLGWSIPELDKEVVWEEVHEEVRRLDGGKAAGLDGIVPELLKKAGKAMEVALVSLYNHAWRKLEWPADWQRAYYASVQRVAVAPG